jgi:FkbM family methyltransferase
VRQLLLPRTWNPVKISSRIGRCDQAKFPTADRRKKRQAISACNIRTWSRILKRTEAENEQLRTRGRQEFPRGKRMKWAFQKIAHSLGYQVSRISSKPAEPAHSDPFAEMRRLCRGMEGLTIFDVGAHHGQTARKFRGLFPEARIFSFEPFLESFDVLKRHVAHDPNIRIFDFGLSSRDETSDFNSNSYSETNSLLSSDRLGARTWGEGLLETKEIVRAKFKMLDSVISELQLPKIDILKLDVQGAEHLVMKGAGSACRERRINIIYSEIITQPTYVGQKRLDEALGVFYESGFDLHNIYNLNSSESGRLRQVDAIFTRLS